MRIGIDARLYSESGVGRYIRNLIQQLQVLDEKNEYYIFLLKNEYDRLVYHTNFHKVLADFGWYGVSEQIKFPSLLKKYGLDLVHFPHFNIPIFYRGKFVVTIHDLIHQHFQMRRATTHDPLTYRIKRLGYNFTFKNAINQSKKILVPSNYIKKQLANEWLIKEDKIKVTYEAVEEHLVAIATHCTQKEIEKVLKKYGVRPPFIFYVGNAHPHKNVEGLIKSFGEIRKKYQYLQLVLSGNDHYFWQRIRQEYKHEDIIYTSYINDQELVALYKSAQAFVLPSFEEGFGIPILEAFACRCPVVSSNAGSLHEVAGNAALYFDPKDLNDMQEKIMQMLDNQKLRSEFTKKGEKRYKQFSWEKLAKDTLNIYNAINE